MSTNKVIVFVLAMTVISSFLLAGLFYATEDMAKTNEAVFNKRAILGAVKDYIPNYATLTDEQVLDIFSKIEQTSIDANGNVLADVSADAIDMQQERKLDLADRKLPFFKFSAEGKDYYIMSFRGKGLWDDIWGYVALESDMNTIAGASFDHKGETPGLGAEIKDNVKFPANFIGKTIYDASGTLSPVSVSKGPAKPNTNAVDGISGATITGDGVGKMIAEWMPLYDKYVQKLKSEGKIGMK